MNTKELTARQLIKYNVPRHVLTEVDRYLKSRAAFQRTQNSRDKRKMIFDYETAYSSIKHCVVGGYFPQDYMWELIDTLRLY